MEPFLVALAAVLALGLAVVVVRGRLVAASMMAREAYQTLSRAADGCEYVAAPKPFYGWAGTTGTFRRPRIRKCGES